jgi:hypothetical protein
VRQSEIRKLVSSSAGSVSRVAEDRTAAAASLRDREARDSVRSVVKPRSVSGGMRKLGAVLVATPDPFTGVPGVVLLASSVVMKKREPAGISHLAKEARKILGEVESLRI